MSNNSASDLNLWHKRIAKQCNNAAWDLIEKPDLDAGECITLARLAAISSYHWGEIGSAGNVAGADVLFSWALARAGAGAAAVAAAQRALEYFCENNCEDWQRAFAHAAMAVSFYCANDREGHRRHYLEAKQLEGNLAPEDLKFFQAAFRTVPHP